MSEQTIYSKFIEWLSSTWIGLPETDELMPLIEARYTPEEAELLTGIPFSGRSVEELAEAKGTDPAELEPRMEALAKKGAVFRGVKDGSARYSLNDSMFSLYRSVFWPGRADEAAKAVASRANQYFGAFFDQYAEVHTKGLRALPIEGTIDDTRQILPYEDVVKVIDGEDYFCVATCPCRHRKNLDPEEPDCEHETKNCLHFGRLARYMVEQGLGREITREETREILRQSADKGLVHGLSNWQKEVDTICNCCKCCCIWFECYHVLNHSESMEASNYEIVANTATCKGCGLCVKRCPMEALALEDNPAADNKTGKTTKLDGDRCIGCGVCVHKCPTKSLVLTRREAVTDPPEDMRECGMRFATELKAASKQTQ
jgi:Pyruvate/2-oxoacid:ferredoxin oxidoreductase delta subunit